MRVDVELTNFTAGELSPRMRGRTDMAKYSNGCETLLNMVVMPQGGVTRRPGTRYVAPNNDQAHPPRLAPFVFSTQQAYVVEFSDHVARFFANDGLVLNGGVPATCATVWGWADLPQLHWTQSADTMYLVHPLYPPQYLTRTAAATFFSFPIVFRDGPYLSLNATATTLTPSGTSGVITITASAIAGINNNTGFQPTDIGRFVRIKVSALWGWAIITGVTSTTLVTATVQQAVPGGANGVLDGTTATLAWALGKWSGTTGYPYTVAFWQNRLVLAGCNNQPNSIDCSVTGDFTNFAPSAADSSVVATNALSWIISDDQVNAVRWVIPAGSAQAAQLGIGTSGGENILQAQTTGAALTPTNVQAYRETSFGCAAQVQPLRVAKSVLFVSRAARKLHEWTFSWQVNGYLGPDLTVMAEHLTRAGVVDQVWQQWPHGVVWQWLADGSLIGLTYLRDQDVVGWHRHILGGQYFGGPPKVEGGAVIPSPSGARYDELWLAVVRTINGVVTRTIEVMTPYFEGAPADQAVFLDCSVTSPLTTPAAAAIVSGLVNSALIDGAPAFTGAGTLVTSPGVLSPANVGNVLRINGGAAVVTGFTSSTVASINVLTGRPLANQMAAAPGSWSLTARASSMGGLAYLAGEQVAALADGLVVPPAVQVGDTLAIPGGGSLVTAGLPMTSVLVPMPIEPPGRGGVGQGRLKRFDHVYLRFHETLGGMFGARTHDEYSDQIADITEPIETRHPGDEMDVASPLFSGSKRLPNPGGADADLQIIVAQTEPLPLTVLAIGARGDLAEVSG